MSLDVIRGEVESMGKAHQNIAQQMKGELEEPLSAFAGGIKERRKIVQTGIEKLLKTKTQQTTAVNKARDKYEQDCLKIKGYLAQGHMVMGQEERKNKAKLEKTQIQMSTTSNEYEAAVKILEETTGRWNREWKAACDKFQDLEEERIDFMKSSLWSFANIASTVCVSDDASCEKVRLSLEDCDVEKDVTSFIKEQGTGQEIPDPPKFINFCRGDINDTASEVSDDGYSVAQFQRTMNPVFRTSSPQPSTYESHHDPESHLANQMRETSNPLRASQNSQDQPPQNPYEGMRQPSNPLRSGQNQPPPHPYEDLPIVPHNEYPMDGMTQFCRTGPPSDRSSVPSPTKMGAESGDDRSEYSNPTSYSSYEPTSGHPSPTKQFADSSGDDRSVQKKKSGFFQNHSPFRRKSMRERDVPQTGSITPSARNTFAAPPTQSGSSSPTRPFGRQSRNVGFGNDDGASPEPDMADPRANFQLNVGNNVFDVASPDNHHQKRPIQPRHVDESDPIAAALAELKGVTKQTSVRQSADRYHGIATPAPSGTPQPVDRPRPFAGQELRSSQGRTPPPSYDNQPVSRLGAPQPAFTSKQMQQTTASFVNQKRDVFNPPHHQRSQSANANRSNDMPRATSPGPMRSRSPGPPGGQDPRGQSGPYPGAASPNPQSRGQYPRAASPNPNGHPRAASPNPYGGPGPHGHPRAASPNPYGGPGPSGPPGRPRTNTNGAPMRPGGYGGPAGSPNQMPRARSPQPGYGGGPMRPGSRPNSSRGSDSAPNMAMQLSSGPGGDYGPQGRGPVNAGPPRPRSQMQNDGPYAAAAGPGNQQMMRPRSQTGGGRQFARDGRPILHFGKSALVSICGIVTNITTARAVYMYQAAIPEELSFAKGDMVAVLRHQDDGWWEAEVVGKSGRPGLAPSNYLQQC